MKRKLYRSCQDRVIGGVAGGLGDYFETDTVVFRLIFLLMLFTGIGPLFYIIAWIIIPEDPACLRNDATESKAQTLKTEVHKEFTDRPVPEKSRQKHRVFGIIVIILGIFLLLRTLFKIDVWENFWPSILIIVGLMLILSGRRGQR